ncbi:MAG: AMP-binding protein [Cephaloticoccus sp.]|nr:AMP-binding protein [Cephaloticoccus sp.]
MERVQLEQLVAATGSAEQHGGFTFMVDPYWTPAQRKEYAQMQKSVAGDCDPGPASPRPATSQAKIAQGWLCLPTGGSSGKVRFARHDEMTLYAAVQGFCTHFGLLQVNTVDVLPPWHVSGLMARVRSAATGGQHLAWDWKRLENGEHPSLTDKDSWVISLVPTQLQRLLEQPAAVAWLRQMKIILIGGGPMWPTLAAAAQSANLPIVICYGMTETAAMITAQLPGEFSRGDRSSGLPMPHARIGILADDSTSALRQGETGIVGISGASVMRGYFGGPPCGGSHVTADLGFMDSGGRLHLAGRRDEIVITGGEKVNPREVEAALRATGRFSDLAVVAVPHAEWGQELLACYPAGQELSQTEIGSLLAGLNLSRQQRPKRFLAFAYEQWPRNAQGKLNRAALREAVLAR